MRRLRHPLLLAVLLACGAAVTFGVLLPRWTEKYVAANLREQIDGASDAEAAELVSAMGQLGESALPHLVDLLDDDRPAVRVAARETLRGNLSTWTDEATSTSERKVASLARELAKQRTPRDLHNRVFVKLTALKLLQWEFQSGVVDRTSFLADCSAILEHAVNASSEQIAEEEAETSTELSVTEQPAVEVAVVEPQPEEAPIPSEETSADEESPQLLPRGEETPIPPERLDPQAPRRIRSGEIGTGDTTALAVDPAVFRQLPTRSLIRQLHGVPEVAEQATAELRRRGFKDTTLEIARLLDDPDPQVRLQLVQSLLQQTDLDSATWLWELANDEEPAVRNAALDVLATSSNPLTRSRVSQLRGEKNSTSERR